jgi:branched-chain amino acid transport system ATP-binding protein
VLPLEVRGVSVLFGGVRALSEVSVAAEAGCVTGLIGPNGAGKTTLFNVISGLQPARTGRVLLDGVDVSSWSPARRARQGLGRTFQRLELFSLLTVRENLTVAADLRPPSRRRARPTAALADELLERLGLADVADERADTLPTGRARLVELGRALASEPRVLLLDEPASGLDAHETAQLAALLPAIADDSLAVLLVEHDVHLVMSTCSRVHVLDFGRLLAVGTPAEIQADERVLAAYLGTTAGRVS